MVPKEGAENQIRRLAYGGVPRKEIEKIAHARKEPRGAIFAQFNGRERAQEGNVRKDNGLGSPLNLPSEVVPQKGPEGDNMGVRNCSANRREYKKKGSHLG